MELAIYEDKKSSNFYPLTYLHPVYDLRCGIFTLKEKIENIYGKTAQTLYCREYLADSVKEKNVSSEINPAKTKTILLFNGRLLANLQIRNIIPLEGEEEIFLNNGEIVAVRILNSKNIQNTLSLTTDFFNGFKVTQVNVKMANYSWDLVNNNGAEIANDLSLIEKSTSKNVYKGVHLLNEENIFIGSGTKIKSGVVIDAEKGPVVIGINVTVFPNAVIEGPCFIGDNSMIKIGAKIYENTSIGEFCKVGGEVEESIIHSYSNKQHDGFLGHSYLGQWVNLGADTNTSDLKNNYGNVKIAINGEVIDSGLQFVGLIMGDHSKSGINTMFNTGTVVGISSNIYGSNFPPKAINSFAWGGSDGFVEYRLNKAIEVAEKVTERRNIKFTQTDKDLFEYVFKLTR